ncbi:MAG: hypothetical protein RR585_13950, partial [Coprobacillus sp.]
MKKILMMILCGGLLVACSSSSGYDVKVTDASSSLLSGNNVTITKQDYFEQLLDTYAANEILNEAISSIADKELTDKDAITKLLEEKTKTYAEYSGGDLEKYIKQAGYSSKEEFTNSILLPSVKRELLIKKYIEENLDKMIKDYQVCSFKKITVDKESTALTLIKEATTEAKFDAKMKEYGTSAEDAGVVTKNSTLDDNLKAKLEKLSAVTKDGIYSEAIKLSDDNYAVIYIYGSDHKNKDKITTALSSDSTAQKDIEAIYLKKYN